MLDEAHLIILMQVAEIKHKLVFAKLHIRVGSHELERRVV